MWHIKMAYIDLKSSYHICVTYVWVHGNSPCIRHINMVHRYIYNIPNFRIKPMWMIYSLLLRPICLSHASIRVMFFSNTHQHVFHPCLLQPLFVILICYDLCSIFDFVIQYSFPQSFFFFFFVSIHSFWHLTNSNFASSHQILLINGS
jgi:hypothetical protein